MVTSILEGDIYERMDDVDTVKVQLDEHIAKSRVKGLASVLVSVTVGEGMKNMQVKLPISCYIFHSFILTDDWQFCSAD